MIDPLKKLRLPRCAIFGLVLWNHLCTAGPVLEQHWNAWDKTEIGRSVGDATAFNSAAVTTPVAADLDAGGGKGAAFEFDFGPDQTTLQREAEAARIVGATTYPDAVNASGGTAVGAFGKKVGDAIVFTNLPPPTN